MRNRGVTLFRQWTAAHNSGGHITNIPELVDMGTADQTCKATHSYGIQQQPSTTKPSTTHITCQKPHVPNPQTRTSQVRRLRICELESSTTSVRAIQGFTWSRTEEQRVDAEIKQVSKELGYSLFFWSVVDGLVDMARGTNNSADNPLEALIAIKELKEKSVVLLRDFHLFLIDPNPILIRTLKDVLLEAKTKSKT